MIRFLQCGLVDETGLEGKLDNRRSFTRARRSRLPTRDLETTSLEEAAACPSYDKYAFNWTQSALELKRTNLSARVQVNAFYIADTAASDRRISRA
jgi:hypothetical protein